MNYPAYVICIDGKPLEEENGEITLYLEGDDQILAERFMAIVYLSDDSSRVSIKKFTLNPVTYESTMPIKEFMQRAAETKQKYR